MAKVGVALTEGRTGAPLAQSMDVEANGDARKEDGNTVRPAAFKSLVGQGHAEFQSNRQQVRPPLLRFQTRGLSMCMSREGSTCLPRTACKSGS